MNNRFFKAVKILVLIGMFLFLSGCTCTVKLTKDLEMPAPPVKKIPMKVGLYMSPDFRQYTFRETRMGGTRYVVHLGEALSGGVEKLLRTTFVEAVNLESIEADTFPEEIEVIVVPEIVSIDAVLPPWPNQYVEVLITVKYTFTDLNGRIIWIDTFQGEGRRKLGSAFTSPKNVRQSMQLAVEEQFHKALEGILASKWWESVE